MSLFPTDPEQIKQLLASLGPPRPPRPVAEERASERRLLEILTIAEHESRQAEHVAALRLGLVEVLGERLEGEFQSQLRDFKLSEASQVTYGKDTARFRKWCAEADLSWLPAAPETVAAFLLETCCPEDGLKPAMASRLSTAIKLWHLLKGHTDPTDSPYVRAVRRWIKQSVSQPIAAATPPDQPH